jgi:hypothetical protein
MRRLWLVPIAVGSGLVLSALVWLSMSMTTQRLATEQRMEQPWQNGLIGDLTVTMTLVLPTLVILVTALCFFVEHRGEMWKQLRATPQPMLAIYGAKFVTIQLLVLLAIGTALVTALFGWALLPAVLQRELASSAAAARWALVGLAGALYISVLPVAIVQFFLSARLPNILHPVGIGLTATFASLMAMGPGTGPWLPYAYPGAVIMSRFAAPARTAPEQTTDAGYRAPPDAFQGIAAGAAILIDEAHENRHGIGSMDAPGTLRWLEEPARAARLPLRVSRLDLSDAALAEARLLILAGASRPLARQEVDAVVKWVEAGGSLLLLTDHEPFASPALELGRRLGLRFSVEMVPSSATGSGTRLRFTRADGALAAHPLTGGAANIVTYGGQALWREEAGTVSLLGLPRRLARPGAAQLLAFRFGRGRVVASGETGLFTAQRHADGSPVGLPDRSTDNERLVLNCLRWLLHANDQG